MRLSNRFVQILVLSIILLLLTACGAEQGEAAENTENEEKQTIYFASTRYVGFDGPEDVSTMTYAFKSAFDGFNEENETYQIEAVLYKDETDLQLSLVSGETMDVLDLYGLTTDVYLARDLFLDLYSYLDADSELSREDFVPAYLSMAEENGELNFLSMAFSIRTYAAPTELVGSESGWTVAQFAETLAAMPENWTVFSGMDAESLLSDYLVYSLEQYVDWETGSINLRQDDFYTILEICKDYCDNCNMAENALLYSVNTIFGMDDWILYCRNNAGTDTLIGYPGAEGNGALRYYAAEQLAISAQSKCPEGAWEFLKYMVKSDAHNSVGLPVLQEKLDIFLDEAQEDVLNEDGTVDTEGMTDEERASFLAFLEGSENTSCGSSASTAISMILEEAASYFSGDKTAEEVITIMENRVGIYLSELT